ncbi:hypothetical protein NDU88_005291 [Pleurodeles waltl]|uniref:Uncharacterized protein n=1 Tax=Pleurodeles waltl TaxID=8319 RepID=A0AAV7PFH7_PLEWA|nr:hypothetical protein NDU88_005291 [Pleurodeles waltl]
MSKPEICRVNIYGAAKEGLQQQGKPQPLTWAPCRSRVVACRGLRPAESSRTAMTQRPAALMTRDNIEAIQGISGALENKIDSVTIEVMLIPSELPHDEGINDRDREYCGSLKVKTKTLKDQVGNLQASAKVMEAGLEDF